MKRQTATAVRMCAVIAFLAIMVTKGLAAPFYGSAARFQPETNHYHSGLSSLTEAVAFDGVRGDARNVEYELSYNTVGDLLSDGSRGLTGTEWNAEARTVKYSFSGGHRQDMTWDGLNSYDYGARNHIPSFPRFNRIDPLAEKNGDQSPYLFCGGNPIFYSDPSGMLIIADSSSQKRILDGFDQDVQKYIEFDEYGVLDSGLLSKCDVDSENLSDLKLLSESNVNIIVTTTDSYLSKDGIINLGSYTKEGNKGETLFPDIGSLRSLDTNVHVYSSSFLNGEHGVTNIAH